MAQPHRKLDTDHAETRKLTFHGTEPSVEHIDTLSCTSLSLQNNHFLQPFNLNDFLSLFSKLKTLRISQNSLVTIPAQVFTLKDLKILDLSCNTIKAIPDEILNLGNIVSLNLEKNLLEDINPVVFRLPKLRFLFAGENNITRIDKSVTGQSSLVALDLRSNPLCAHDRETCIGIKTLEATLGDRVIIEDMHSLAVDMERRMKNKILRGIAMGVMGIALLVLYLSVMRLFREESKIQQ